MFTEKNVHKGENAISAVIGVILMIAITVIIAAVVSSIVFGIGPAKSSPKTSIKAVSANPDLDYVRLENQGGVQFSLYNLKVIVEQDGRRIVFPRANSSDSEKFLAGDALFVYTNSGNGAQGIYLNGIAGNGKNLDAVPDNSGNLDIESGTDVMVTLVDIRSGQIISKLQTTVG